MLYTDSIKFPIMFDYDSGQTLLDSTVTSINRCIGLLCTTAKGELLGNPDFGCNLYKLLFNNVTKDYITSVQEDIVNSITKYESRVSINKSDIDISENSNNTNHDSYTITIKYRISNSSKSFETSIRMEEKLSV